MRATACSARNRALRGFTSRSLSDNLESNPVGAAMRVTSTVLAATAAGFLGAVLSGAVLLAAGPAAAQVVSDAGPPQPMPPAGFDGQQYVDERGCVYIRAGVAGDVTWVPRVNRAREVICNPPSGGADTSVATAPESEAPDSFVPEVTIR